MNGSRSRGRETDDFLFAAAGDVRRRHESYFHVFLGAGHQIAAATQVELVFNVLAMAFDGFDTQVERAIWVLPRPEPNKKKMCVSRSDNFSMPIVGRAERCCCSDRVSSDFLNARIATSWLT